MSNLKSRAAEKSTSASKVLRDSGASLERPAGENDWKLVGGSAGDAALVEMATTPWNKGWGKWGK